MWIGPPAAAIEAMGSKIESRRRMAAAGVPVVPGTTERVTTRREGHRARRRRSAGRSRSRPRRVAAGAASRSCAGPSEAERALASAEREGEAYFADGAVYVERYIDDPRHVEIQVLADRHGAVIHLGERDCTLQRRHQKVVEESPSPALDDELRERMGAMAVAAARAVGYVSAGTVECLVDPQGVVLLPRDEHAHPGRAQRHRARDRRRSRARADRDRGGRAARAAPGGRAAARPRLRVPRQRRGRGRRLPAGPGPDHALPRAGRPGRARRLGHRGGRRGRRPVRPDDRQAARLGRRPPARDRAHAARARRVRDRGRADAAAAAPADLRPPRVPGRRDVRGARRGRRSPSSSRPPGRPRPRARPRWPATIEVELDGRRHEVRVLEPVVAALAAERQRRDERRARGRRAGAGGEIDREPDAGNGAAGRGCRGRACRIWQGARHSRSDEDGERDRRGPCRAWSPTCASRPGDAVRSGQVLLSVVDGG